MKYLITLIFVFLLTINANLFSQDKAKVQFIHNAADPDLEYLDVYIDGVFQEEFEYDFRKATGFIELDAEVDIRFAVAPRGSISENDTIKSWELHLAENHNYIAMLVGVEKDAGFMGNPNTRPIMIDLIIT